MAAEYILPLGSMLALLLCSAFFSGTETALFSLGRDQVAALRRSGRPAGRLLGLLAKNPSGLLIAILFGNLVVNILFYSTGAVLALGIGGRFGAAWQTAFSVAALLLVILAGEILPKAVGMSHAEQVVLLNAPALLGWYHLLGPVRRGMERIVRRMEPAEDHAGRISAAELKMLIDATHHDPSFGRQEKAIVEDIVTLPEIRLRQVMVPRVQQLLLRADMPCGEALRLAAGEQLGLVPVYRAHEDDIAGVVEVRELFIEGDPSRPLSGLLHPVRFVPETKRADAMLHEFLEEGLRMACVVDEYGGLSGTVVLENLLEEVVGEFAAPEAPDAELLGAGRYRLQGRLGIREWRSLFTGFLPEEAMRNLALDTVSGLVVSLLKRMPRPGDEARLGNLRFTVERVRANRIETVVLDLAPAGEGGP